MKWAAVGVVLSTRAILGYAAVAPPPPVGIATFPFPTASPGPTHRYLNYNTNGNSQCTAGNVASLPDLVGSQTFTGGAGFCSTLYGGILTPFGGAPYTTSSNWNPSDGSAEFSLVVSGYKVSFSANNAPLFSYTPMTGPNVALGPISVSDSPQGTIVVTHPGCPSGVAFTTAAQGQWGFGAAAQSFTLVVTFSARNGVAVYANGQPYIRMNKDLGTFSPMRGCEYGAGNVWDGASVGAVSMFVGQAGTTTTSITRVWQDVQFYNYSLTPAQSMALFTYPAPPPPPISNSVTLRTPERFSVIPYNLTSRYIGPAGQAGIVGGMLVDSVGSNNGFLSVISLPSTVSVPYLSLSGTIDFGQFVYQAGVGSCSWRILTTFAGGFSTPSMTVTHNNYIFTATSMTNSAGTASTNTITVTNRVTGASITRSGVIWPAIASIALNGYITFIAGPSGVLVLYADQLVASFSTIFPPVHTKPYVSQSEISVTWGVQFIYDIQFYNDAIDAQDVIVSAQGAPGS